MFDIESLQDSHGTVRIVYLFNSDKLRAPLFARDIAAHVTAITAIEILDVRVERQHGLEIFIGAAGIGSDGSPREFGGNNGGLLVIKIRLQVAGVEGMRITTEHDTVLDPVLRE